MLKNELFDIISQIPEDKYDELKRTIEEKYRSRKENLPSDFYYDNAEHYFYSCRKMIKNKKIIDVRAVQPSLKNFTEIMFNFSVKNIKRINELSLIYPVESYTYFINNAKNQFELLEAIKTIKKILEDYDIMIKMSKEEILNSEYKFYVDYKKMSDEYQKTLIIKNGYWDNSNKVFKEFNKNIEEELNKIINKYGIYKLFDEDKNLIYIGKSYNLAQRIPSSICERKTSYFSYTILNNKVDTDIYEIYYIAKYKPLLNGTSKNEDFPTIKLKELEFSDVIYIF